MIESGITASEEYLASLGKRSFLSLWVHSNVYYEPGKELADLLVICGNDVIIFQDKWSSFPKTKNIEQAWQRWFKRTVVNGAKQTWGAERILKKFSTKLYLDPACKIPLPIGLTNLEGVVFHLIVVTHGASMKCKELLGGSGSFMINSDIKHLSDHGTPFVVGDLDYERTFVHVFDDTTLDILMHTLDTITDFTLYLRKKEKLLRSKIAIIAAGDEELLANYLKHMNENNEHDFDFGNKMSKGVNMVALDEGGWISFTKNPQRLAQVKQDKISYLWDDLIEIFSHHARADTQYLLPELRFVKGVEATEKIVRFMAREPRFMRRLLSLSIVEMLKITPENQRRIRVMSSYIPEETTYVVLLFPLPKSPKISYEDYRKMRAIFLEGTCMVAKMRDLNLKHIVGIATETGTYAHGRSEDAMYLDTREWSAEMQAAAKKFQDELGILVKPQAVPMNVSEYPEVVSREEFLKNPRNKPCPCGSGKKYKRCCESKGVKFYQ